MGCDQRQRADVRNVRAPRPSLGTQELAADQFADHLVSTAASCCPPTASASSCSFAGGAFGFTDGVILSTGLVRLCLILSRSRMGRADVTRSACQVADAAKPAKGLNPSTDMDPPGSAGDTAQARA